MFSHLTIKFNQRLKNVLTKSVCWNLVLGKRYIQAPRRFYKNVTVSQSDGLHEINLDRRKLKTPLGNVLQVTNESLAIAVASEWEMQNEIINLHSMHMTRLCNTALDNPMKKTPEILSASILNFLDTDTICYRQEEPSELAELLAHEWDPVVEWFCKRYDVKIKPSVGINSIVTSQETRQTLTRHLLSYNFWALTGIHYIVEALKSTILTLAAIDRFIDVERAVALSQLELEFQISRWGNIEWAHDIDRYDLRARVAAAVLFTLLNNETSSLKYKNNTMNT